MGVSARAPGAHHERVGDNLGGELGAEEMGDGEVQTDGIEGLRRMRNKTHGLGLLTKNKQDINVIPKQFRRRGKEGPGTPSANCELPSSNNGGRGHDRERSGRRVARPYAVAALVKK